jgi:hypothetical protein
MAARAATERFGVPPIGLLSERHIACFGVLVFVEKSVVFFMHIGKIKKMEGGGEKKKGGKRGWGDRLWAA